MENYLEFYLLVDIYLIYLICNSFIFKECLNLSEEFLFIFVYSILCFSYMLDLNFMREGLKFI